LSEKKTYKRSTYLINPKFQLKTSLFISSLVLIASSPYPYVIYKIIENIFGKLSTGSCSNLQGLASSFEQNKKELILFLIAWQIGFAAFVFIISIFQSHKIAGPIYKLRKILNEIKNGALPQDIRFRNGDHFFDLADDLNATLSSLKERKNNDYQYMEDVEKFLEEVSSQISDDSREKLKDISAKVNQMKCSIGQ